MFFGIGEIISVLANPSDVLRSLAESKRLLEEAKREMKEAQEKSQIPVSHTFSPLPGFHPRPLETLALQRTLSGIPTFTVLFGASSCGKTAVLRQVLSDPRFHVLHFDLRIAGFADLSSLYFSLCEQIESYFEAIPGLMGEGWGYECFHQQSWAFKHDRIDIQKRVDNGGEVKTSDIAHLMELLQGGLVRYWEFDPLLAAVEASKGKERDGRKKKKPKVEIKGHKLDPTELSMRGAPADLVEARTVGSTDSSEDSALLSSEEDEDGMPVPPVKKIPVFFIDEAHKLPALIKGDEDAMKALLDSFLVLTKQDRLIHIVHATSDPFYMQWLRMFNIMQHASILSMGDCSKSEAFEYFSQNLVKHVPEDLRDRLDFEELYAMFGGKLAHLNDFVTEFVNADGNLIPSRSSHFIQAHSLLNLHLIHSMPIPKGALTLFSASKIEESTLPSPTGFQIHSPLRIGPAKDGEQSSTAIGGSEAVSEFCHEALLSVMRRLAPRPLPSSSSSSQNPLEDLPVVSNEIRELSYFALCRELGAGQVDGFVRGRILELRWSECITEEGEGAQKGRRGIGPVLVPTTPVVRYAMGVVVKEWDE